MKLMKQITKTLAGIKTITYLWVSKWYIKLKRVLAPLRAVMTFSKRVCHILHPCLGALFLFKCPSQDYQKTTGQNPVQADTGVQKSKVFVMFWWRKIQTMSYRLTIWSVIPEMVTYAYTRPVPDRDAKQHLEVKSRFSLFEISRNSGISPDKT